ncbi:hypothetical protein B4146_3845 [Bacillus subtilis]|uniref:Uncharacterized protein n=1 Tax=Bacillus subtilis TaxID=1423 RepID=A0AAP1H9Q3_BACIU|nr:hypothetical protein B4146_3845 [Bacillus subtilis]KZD92357.1 hypothetical protein B4122_1696 [Bacillus subtilis]
MIRTTETEPQMVQSFYMRQPEGFVHLTFAEKKVKYFTKTMRAE